MQNAADRLKHAALRLLEVIGRAITFGIAAAQGDDDVDDQHRPKSSFSGFLWAREKQLRVLQTAIRGQFKGIADKELLGLG